MTANPITEKYHPSDPIAGLPGMNRVHDENEDGPHTNYLAMLGRRVNFNSARGEHSGIAMLVIVPDDTEVGDWLVMEGDNFTAAKADGTQLGRVGVSMASVNPDYNDITKPLFGWIMIEGRMAAKMEAGVVEGDMLTLDPGFTPGQVGTGGAQALPAKAMSDVGPLIENVSVPDNIPEYPEGYGEIYLVT
ncbi:hypothetical protein [uncultured Pelagimonas sp.]|uniref:hypothetical protein n=1 Tax=uncultured Pelagimonas sp. TaxID=1618102 RepID=UPI0026155452|nr:hypothetical protein [uncultured Pelagimonas sp.]